MFGVYDGQDFDREQLFVVLDSERRSEDRRVRAVRIAGECLRRSGGVFVLGSREHAGSRGAGDRLSVKAEDGTSGDRVFGRRAPDIRRRDLRRLLGPVARLCVGVSSADRNGSRRVEDRRLEAFENDLENKGGKL